MKDSSLKSAGASISRANRLKARFAAHVKRAGNLGLKAGRAILFLRRKPPANPSRIVVHLIGNVGDIVVAIPALVALRERFPASHLTLVTSAGEREKNLAGALDLLRDAPFLDRVEAYATEDIRRARGVLELLKRVRSIKPDLMVSLPPCDIPFGSVVRNLLFARLTGARFCVGYDHVNMRLFPFAQAQHFGLLPSEISRNFAHLRELGVEEKLVRFEFGTIDRDEERRVEELFSDGRPFMAICPGGKQVGHRWPAERFTEVAARLRSEQGLRLIAVGSLKERELCESVLDGAGGGLNLAGELSLRGTTHLLSKAQVLLTNDTGPMHLAAATGTKVVAIFGTRDFAGRWWPHGDGHEIFRAVLNCERCLFGEETDHCVGRITVEEVYEGCVRVLRRLDHAERNGSDKADGHELIQAERSADLELNTA